MKVPTPHYHSPLARMQREVTDLEAVKREGWRSRQILVVSVEDERLDFVERELVRRLGERLYGANEGRDG